MSTLLTLGEVADRLGVSVRTVTRMVDSGTLPFLRVSARKVRVREEDLRSWIEARVRGEAQPATEI